MSILNLALQNVALTREECNANTEQILRSANTMADVRTKASKVSSLKQEWLNSVKPIVYVLNKRTEQLSLKGDPFIVKEPGDDDGILLFQEQVRMVVDEEIQIGQYQQKHVANKPGISI